MTEIVSESLINILGPNDGIRCSGDKAIADGVDMKSTVWHLTAMISRSVSFSVLSHRGFDSRILPAELTPFSEVIPPGYAVRSDKIK